MNTDNTSNVSIEELAENYSEGWGENDDKIAFIAGANSQQSIIQQKDERIKELELSLKSISFHSDEPFIKNLAKQALNK
jgi:hypothetical protein